METFFDLLDAIVTGIGLIAILALIIITAKSR